MKDDDQTTQSKKGRSIAHDIHHAFVDWATKLPFMKRDVANEPGWEHAGEVSANETPAPHPTTPVSAGPPQDNEQQREPVPAKHVFAATSSAGQYPVSEDRTQYSTETAPVIRIERLNADKTRKDIGWDTVYHVYFELSAPPAPEWRNIFARQWIGLNTAREASIDGAFLVLHCQLHEVATPLLPALKKAVAATNDAYARYAQKEATALGKREDVWKEERKAVDAMASSLRFD